MEITSAPLSERIFWPRPSEAVLELAEVIVRPPERQLDEAEIAAVMAFDNELYEGRYGAITCEVGLQDLPDTTDVTHRIVPEYFTSEAGANALQAFTGQDTAPVTTAEAADLLLHMPFGLLEDDSNKKVFKKELKGASLKYAKGKYQKAAREEDVIDDIEMITLNDNPDAFVDKLAGLVHYKRFLQSVQRELKQECGDNPNGVADAKLAVAQMYRDAVNAKLAQMYPEFQAFLMQIDAQVPEVQERFAGRLALIPGVVATARRAARSERMQPQFIRLLDYVRNGAAYDDNGRLTPIDPQIWEDVDVLNEIARHAENIEGVFGKDEIAELMRIKMDSAAIDEVTQRYMEAIGIAGWGTEIREDKDSFSVSGTQKKVWIPAGYKSSPVLRSSTAGVVGTEIHEVGGRKPGHVFQSINASRSNKTLRIAKDPNFRGKRYVALREVGGIMAEADVNERLFGQFRGSSPTYAAALERLTEGASVSEAVAAFAITKLRDTPDPSEEERAKAYAMAADRVLRLTRFGGRNSQPMQYVEAATVRRVIEPLGDELEQIILAEAVYDPLDMVRLHRFGLLPLDTEHFFQPTADPEEVMTNLLREMLENRRRTAAESAS